jgi:UDP-2,3-diacylglucosamine pyrophosphatase LpxH
MAKTHYRAVWISDLHLGANSANPQKVNDFLDTFTCDDLYLVGDIIDGWRLKSRWFWPDTNSGTIRKILKKVKQGSRVVYLPGNHDEFIRSWLPLEISFGGVSIQNEAVHITLTGKKILVLHGDIFDSAVRLNPILSWFGSTSYDFLVVSNKWTGKLMKLLGRRHWSFSKYIKKNFKSATNFIFHFEHHVSEYARRRGYDGIVCGHIHKPEIRPLNGIIYYNCGDWVESFSALVETPAGELKLIHFQN